MEQYPEKFHLKWNDFESNLSLAFRDLKDDRDFFDVTLSVGDQQVKAHKVILSCCSPFFKSVLKQNPHEHPLLYLKGVKYTDLTRLLDFMYHGEVDVAKDELSSFLLIAEELQVKGLSQNEGGRSSQKTPVPSSQKKSSNHGRASSKRSQPAEKGGSKRKKEAPIPVSHEPDCKEDLTIKMEPLSSSASDLLTPNKIGTLEEEELVMDGEEIEQTDNHVEIALNSVVTEMTDTYDESGCEEGYVGFNEVYGGAGGIGVDNGVNIDVVDAYSFRTELGKYMCRVCEHTARDKYDIRLHLEGRHSLSTGYQCPSCLTTFKTNKKFAEHKNRGLCQASQQ